MTRVDVDGDGAPDNLARLIIDLGPCDPKHELEKGKSRGHDRLVVVDDDLKKVHHFSRRVHAGVEDDVFWFKGKLYTDSFMGEPISTRKIAGRDGTLHLYKFSQYGATLVCKFHYFESQRSNGEK